MRRERHNTVKKEETGKETVRKDIIKNDIIKNEIAGQEKCVLMRIRKHILEFLYPPRCVLCDRVLKSTEDGCCGSCRARLPYIKEPRCMKCGKPVADEEQEYCDDCREYTHYFDRGTAPFAYTGRLRASVYRMKSVNRRDYIAFYAQEMARAVRPYLARWAVQVILPVPMHPKKRRARGYNQAELLAREVGALLGLPVETEALCCIKKTAAQKQLDRRGRMQNLQGSFVLREDFLRAGSVLLVDDIYTTGSTVDEISRVLKAAGVQRVFFVVLCTGKGKRR